jgi:type VI secretion system VasD/TssJ family lipoprotein
MIEIARTCGLVVLVALTGCASVPLPQPLCSKPEEITLRVYPAAQMNQDREGFARSVVLRLYQLQDTRSFQASTFDAIWSTPDTATRPDEWIVLPGQRVAHALRRDPNASHLAVAANFREHRGESGWRTLIALPAPHDPCTLAATDPPLAVNVVLSNYAVQLR